MVLLLWYSGMGFPGGSEVKASDSNTGDLGSIPGLGRSPGEGNGTPLQYSCLENPMDRGAWWAAVHGVAKSRTRLSDFTSSNFCCHGFFFCKFARERRNAEVFCLLLLHISSSAVELQYQCLRVVREEESEAGTSLSETLVLLCHALSPCFSPCCVRYPLQQQN